MKLIEQHEDDTKKNHVNAWLQETFIKQDLFQKFKFDWKLEDNGFKGSPIGEMLAESLNKGGSYRLVDLIFSMWNETEENSADRRREKYWKISYGFAEIVDKNDDKSTSNEL